MGNTTHDPSALALLIYSERHHRGAKGVMLGHANIDAMADMGRQALTRTGRPVSA